MLFRVIYGKMAGKLEKVKHNVLSIRANSVNLQGFE